MVEAEGEVFALSGRFMTINGSRQVMTTDNLARPRERFTAIAMGSCASATELSLLVRVGIGILTQ